MWGCDSLYWLVRVFGVVVTAIMTKLVVTAVTTKLVLAFIATKLVVSAYF